MTFFESCETHAIVGCFARQQRAQLMGITHPYKDPTLNAAFEDSNGLRTRL
jgi:hypothetical protein